MTWMFNEMAQLMKEFETENRRIRKENKQKLNDVSKSSNDIYQLLIQLYLKRLIAEQPKSNS